MGSQGALLPKIVANNDPVLLKNKMHRSCCGCVIFQSNLDRIVREKVLVERSAKETMVN